MILGKANLREWANFRTTQSSSGWSAVEGQTNDPYVLARNPCGSSSGRAVGPAAHLATVAIGTKTLILSSSTPAATAGYPNVTVPMGRSFHLPSTCRSWVHAGTSRTCSRTRTRSSRRPRRVDGHGCCTTPATEG